MPPPWPQDPRHLQYFADLTESNIYYVTQGKKHYGTPTEFGFCIKVRPFWAPYPALHGVFAHQGVSESWGGLVGCSVMNPALPRSPTRCAVG